jgi:hypothetical protein
LIVLVLGVRETCVLWVDLHYSASFLWLQL